MLIHNNSYILRLTCIYRLFKPVKGENGTTSFLPLDGKKGGPVRYIKDMEAICLTEEQMRYIYKKVEFGSEINIDTMRQEMDNDKLTGTKTSEEEEINPYQKVILNNMYIDEIRTAQLEYWSILSGNVKYVQHDERSNTLCMIYTLRLWTIAITRNCITN